MVSDYLFNTKRYQGLKFDPHPVEHNCSLCRHSKWGADSRGRIHVEPGQLACYVHMHAVNPNNPPCHQYHKPNKSYTIYVEACRRDVFGRVLQ